MTEKCQALSEANFEDFLNSFDTFLCDCDGVLWRGKTPIPDAIHFLNKLQNVGKKVILVTNNSVRTKKGCLEKCKRFGLNVSEDQVYSTTYLAATYLKKLGFNKKVYIMGGQEIAEELDIMGIQSCGVGPDTFGEDKHPLSTIIEEGVALDDEVGAVVVGFDVHISYLKLLKAASYLNDPDCHFIATDADESALPTSTVRVRQPGPGTIVRSVESCSGRKAFLVGKPSSFMFETIKAEHGISPERTVMIGDNIHTDIQLGKNCDLKTVVVLSGVTTEEDINHWKKSPEDHQLIADYCLSSLGDLYHLLP